MQQRRPNAATKKEGGRKERDIYPAKWTIKNRHDGDFPGGPVVQNLPSNAGDTGLIPGRGTKIPHAAGQLSLRAATTEPACRN